MKLIFVRHGQSQANLNGIIGDSSPELTEEGIDQASKTGLLLRDFGIECIVSSPIVRALQTAEQIAMQIGISPEKIVIVDELRERGLGVLENNPKLHDSDWYYSPLDEPTVENLQDLEQRMIEALRKIVEIADNRVVCVVGHSISGFFLEKIIKKETGDSISLETELKNAGFKVFDI